MTTDTANKTKVSFSIIGDAFVDLFCLLNDGLPPLGGDKRVDHPMTPCAGGSGVNTATHLSALVREFSANNDNPMDITLQTAINEKDYYGQVIVEHATKNSFEMINCNRRAEIEKDDDETDENQKDEKEGNSRIVKKKSTGHCIVLVNQGERSFVSHIGIMESFKASHTALHELINCRTADPNYTNLHHHIHVTGYYNLPGFGNGNLKKRLKLVREKRRAQSYGLHTLTTTISLVPQYDATEQWDDGLLKGVLPLVDFLILNSLEAGKLTRIGDSKESINRAAKLSLWAEFFLEVAPLTHVIVTLGEIGAVCLYQGEVVASMRPPKSYKNPVDPTGAGDAFSAGFLFGIMNWRKQYGHEECAEIGSELQGSWTKAIIEGMRYGCCAGTACVSRVGASIPAPKEDIEAFLNCNEEEEIDFTQEAFGDAESSNESEDESYYPEESYDYSDSYDRRSDEEYNSTSDEE